MSSALDIIDAEGAAALTLRTLAQRLGSSTATLYRHFDSRADLVAHVGDHLFGEVDADTESLAGLDWSQACRQLGAALFDVFSRHPNAGPLLAGIVPAGPHAMAFRERCLSILVDAGIAPKTALIFSVALMRFCLGFAMQTAATDGAHDVAPRLANDRSTYPLTASVAEAIPIPLVEEFRSGLDLIVRGMRDFAGGMPAPTNLET